LERVHAGESKGGAHSGKGFRERGGPV
jgi:hypothetical protein